MHDKNLPIKGPSKAGIHSDLYSGIFELQGKGNYAILDQGGHIIGEAFGENGPSRSADAEANARLWSIAPNLLTPCENLIKYVKEWYTLDGSLETAASTVPDEVELINIAKCMNRLIENLDRGPSA